MAYVANEILDGQADGFRKIFTTNNAISQVTSLQVNNIDVGGYTYANTNLTLVTAPELGSQIAISYHSPTAGGQGYNDRENGKVTLSGIIRRVRELLNETHTEYWSDTEIVEWVNSAANEICMEGYFPFMQDVATIEIDSNTSKYALPPNYNKIIALYSDSATGTSTELLYAEYDRFKTDPNLSSSNRHYSLMGDYFYVRTSTSETLEFLYYKYPQALSAPGDVTIIPPEIEDVLIFKTAANCLMKEQEAVLAREYFDKAQYKMGKYISNADKNPSKKYPGFKQMANYYIA